MHSALSICDGRQGGSDALYAHIQATMHQTIIIIVPGYENENKAFHQI